MTHEIIENNRLIAEFMGYKTWVTTTGVIMVEDENTFAGHLSAFQRFHYHNDWNRLMLVVEKINRVHFSDFKNYIHSWDLSAETSKVTALPISTPIGKVYSAIIAFIHYYNNQEK